MKTITKEQLEEILELHRKWLNDEADGQRADLGDAILRCANLGDVILRGAILRGVDLRGAYLGDADLRGAYLSGADLSGAYLRDVDLSGANLSGANLDKRYISISLIGSLKNNIIYCFDDDIIWCDSFKGTLKDFKIRVKETHKYNPQYLKEYLGAIAYIGSLK